MNLILKRIASKQYYTIGRLYEVLNGKAVYLCDTLEPNEKKRFGRIPNGRYVIHLKHSQKFNALMPYLSVDGRTGIMFHPGNTPADTKGCILVGENKLKGRIINSKAHFQRLMNLINEVVVENKPISVVVRS